MNRPEYWPSVDTEDLLRACFERGSLAVQAWERWSVNNDLDTVPYVVGRLLPTVYGNLRAEGLAEEELSRIKGIYRYCWVKNTRNIAQLKKLMPGLQEQGIELMALKGLDIIARYHRQVGLRYMEDVDLLVRPSHALKAIKFLCQEGGYEAWPNDLPKFVSANYGINLTHPDGYEIDLHWFALDACSWKGADDPMWKDAVSEAHLGLHMKWPSPECSLLQTCVHGFRKSGDHHTHWISDSIHILRQYPDFSWTQLFKDTQKRRVTWPVERALEYLHYLQPKLVPLCELEAFREVEVSQSERAYFGLEAENLVETYWSKLHRSIRLYERRFQDGPGVFDWFCYPAYLMNRRGGKLHLPKISN